MARVVYLTTLDNPYSPVDEFVEWFKFDELHGYHTTGYIAALAHTRRDRPIPVYFLGVGEGVADLEAFSAREFASALVD